LSGLGGPTLSLCPTFGVSNWLDEEWYSDRYKKPLLHHVGVAKSGSQTIGRTGFGVFTRISPVTVFPDIAHPVSALLATGAHVTKGQAYGPQ